MAGYIGTQAVSVNTTSATISDDLSVGDDLTVTDDATIGGTALVTGVLTTTAATVFNGGFASNAASTITTADNLSGLIIKSTDQDANVGPTLQLNRDPGTDEAADDALGNIIFVGKNNANEATVYANMGSNIQAVGNGIESGRFFLNTIAAGTERSRMFITAAETVFNEDSVDQNFRVESNGNANALVVDGGTDTVMIGTTDTNFNAGADNLIVGTGSGDCGITIYTGSSVGHKGSIFFGDTAAGDAANSQKGQISYEQNNEIMTFLTNNTLALTLALNGSATMANGLTLTDGDLVIGAGGHGISFAEGASGTSSDNRLDEYEEGTFTVGVTGGTTVRTNATAVYTRIGDLVTFSYYSLSSNLSNASGAMTITGLPFTATALNSDDVPCSVANNTFFGGSATVGQDAFVGKNGTILYFMNVGTTAQATLVNGNGKFLGVSGSYFAA